MRKESLKEGGEGRTYTYGRDPTARRAHVPSNAKWGNRWEVCQAKDYPKMYNDCHSNQQNDQYWNKREREREKEEERDW